MDWNRDYIRGEFESDSLNEIKLVEPSFAKNTHGLQINNELGGHTNKNPFSLNQSKSSPFVRINLGGVIPGIIKNP